jgi:hypothetical protein
MDWRHMAELLTAGQEVFSSLKNLCIWNKTNGGMGSFYRSKHELVFVFKVGTARTLTPSVTSSEKASSVPGRMHTAVVESSGAANPRVPVLKLIVVSLSPTLAGRDLTWCRL